MVNLIRESGVWTFYGLSTDTKTPLSGAEYMPQFFKEVDTGDTYYLSDATEGTWAKYGAGLPDES